MCDTYSASQCSLTADGRHLVLLADMCKELQSANRVACDQFISGPFPRKRTELGRVGVKGKVSEQSKAGKVRAAADHGGKSPGSLRPGGQRPSGPGAKSVKSAPSPQERSRTI